MRGMLLGLIDSWECVAGRIGFMKKQNVANRLGTDTAFINDLTGDIRKGEIKIPQFQRRFVWKEKQALELLDSIANSSPIGSLFLWKTNEKLAVERNIGGFIN